MSPRVGRSMDRKATLRRMKEQQMTRDPSTCPDCLRPLATKAQWDNGHGDNPVVPGPGDFYDCCMCAECVAVCWGDGAYCAKVKAARERKPTTEERYRDALRRILVAVDDEGPNAGDSSLMLFQVGEIANAALKG